MLGLQPPIPKPRKDKKNTFRATVLSPKHIEDTDLVPLKIRSYNEDKKKEQTPVEDSSLPCGISVEDSKEILAKDGCSRNFNRYWRKLVGLKKMQNDPHEYMKIYPLQDKPKFKSGDENLIAQALPYILQKIKMFRCSVLAAETLSTFLEEDDLDDISQQSRSKSGADSFILPFSKVDILTAIISCTEITILAEIFRVLAQFPQALPLVVRDPRSTGSDGSKKYRLLTPALQKCLIRWEDPTKGKLVENYLFRSNYKLITACRMGTTVIGKSSILNQIFKIDSNVFHCRGQDGGDRGPALSLPGHVEFIWLSKYTCKESFWNAVYKEQNHDNDNEILLLANLHGDAMNHLDVFKTVSDISSQFIIFVMPDAVSGKFQSNLKTLTEICGKEMSFIFVDSEIPTSLLLPDGALVTSIDPTFLIDHKKTLGTLTNLLVKQLRQDKEKQKGKRIKESKTACNIEKIASIITSASDDFLECILTLDEDLSKENSSLRDLLLLQKENSIHIKTFLDIWNTSEDLRIVVSRFAKLLKLPLKDRRRALAHVNRELSILSKQRLDKYDILLKSLTEKKKRHIAGNNKDSLELTNITTQIDGIYKRIESSVGLEHFFREIGRVYEMKLLDRNRSPYYELPELYAEMLIEGSTIEILDGDLCSISGVWLEAVCHSVCRKLPNLNVFIVSILGLQSSGKSTLLNALFGCQFVVSVGRCTRGLFMRMLFLEDSLRQKLKVDAILIIDTEGLSSPDNMLDSDAKIKDRKMATFAMTISNLTLINVMGEAKREIVDILQIVIVTMASLEEAKMSPDILLVQHVAEGGNEYRLREGVKQFCKALEEAVLVVEANKMVAGIRNSVNLENLLNSLTTKDILLQVRPFKSGASPEAPPTTEYHEDIVTLRERILEECQNNQINSIGFCQWHKVLKSYWSAVQKQNFALKFIDIREMQEYFDVNGKLAAAKKDFDIAFRKHEQLLKLYVEEELEIIAKSEQQFISQIEDRVLNQIDEYLDNILESCDWAKKSDARCTVASCKWCIEAVFSKKVLLDSVQKSPTAVGEIQKSIVDYGDSLRISTKATIVKLFESGKSAKSTTTELDSVLDNIVKTLQINEHTGAKPTEEELWDSLYCTARAKYPVKCTRLTIVNDVIKQYENDSNHTKNWEAILHDPKNELLKLENLSSNSRKSREFLRSILDLFTRSSKKLKEKLALNSKECVYLGEQLSTILNWTCDTRQGSRYTQEWCQHHKGALLSILTIFVKRFRKVNLELEWQIILIGVQMFVSQSTVIQEDWNSQNEPFCILVANKGEFLRKIRYILQPQRNIEDLANSVGEKLLDAALKVTGNYLETTHLSIKWANTVESCRLFYFSILARQVQSGRLEAALNHFDNPHNSLIEGLFQEIDKSVDMVEAAAVSKQVFIDECKGICREITKAKTVSQLNSFISWYLAKAKFYHTFGITEETYQRIGQIVKTQLESEMEMHAENIMKDVIPSNYDSNVVKLGCTLSCPYCSALCWGNVGHTSIISVHAKHYTCHQPLGLAGAYDAVSGELLAHSCSDYDDPCTDLEVKNVISRVQENRLVYNFEDRAETYWTYMKHPKDEFNELMQWFFLKLNVPLAERYGVRPASVEIIKAMGYDTLDDRLDGILLNIQQRIEY